MLSCCTIHVGKSYLVRSEFEPYVASIAKYFDFKIVSLESTLESQKATMTKLGYKAHEVLTHRLTVADDVVTAFIQHELRKSECITKGWMLVNYPANHAQFEQFERFNPDTLLFICISEEQSVSQSMLEQTKIDTLSGKLYSPLDAVRLKETQARGVALSPLSETQKTHLLHVVQAYERLLIHLTENHRAKVCSLSGSRMEETKGQEALDMIHSYVWEHYH